MDTKPHFVTAASSFIPQHFKPSCNTSVRDLNNWEVVSSELFPPGEIHNLCPRPSWPFVLVPIRGAVVGRLQDSRLVGVLNLELHAPRPRCLECHHHPHILTHKHRYPSQRQPQTPPPSPMLPARGPEGRGGGVEGLPGVHGVRTTGVASPALAAAGFPGVPSAPWLRAHCYRITVASPRPALLFLLPGRAEGHCVRVDDVQVVMTQLQLSTFLPSSGSTGSPRPRKAPPR